MLPPTLPCIIVAVGQVVREAYPDATAFDSASKYYDANSTKDNPKWFQVGEGLSEGHQGAQYHHGGSVLWGKQLWVWLSREVLRLQYSQQADQLHQDQHRQFPSTAAQACFRT
jgi:hypothetical protein